jgi:hypothetical protein
MEEVRNQCCTFNTEDISMRTSIKPKYTRVTIGPSEESENDIEMNINNNKVIASNDLIKIEFE